MPYTVSKLIANAFYTSGVTGRELQAVSGPQLQDGFDLLNEILADKTVENDMIPYYLKYDFPTIIDTEMYFIPNLIEIETLVFFLDTVRMQTTEKDRKTYFGSTRADNIQSLPITWHLEKCYGGANLYLNFKPDQVYQMQLYGLFRLGAVTLNQDLALTLDQFYINYLKYELTDRICTLYNVSVPVGVTKQLMDYEQMISKQSAPLDLRTKIISTFSQPTGDAYGMANLGKGWTA